MVPLNNLEQGWNKAQEPALAAPDVGEPSPLPWGLRPWTAPGGRWRSCPPSWCRWRPCRVSHRRWQRSPSAAYWRHAPPGLSASCPKTVSAVKKKNNPSMEAGLVPLPEGECECAWGVRGIHAACLCLPCSPCCPPPPPWRSPGWSRGRGWAGWSAGATRPLSALHSPQNCPPGRRASLRSLERGVSTERFKQDWTAAFTHYSLNYYWKWHRTATFTHSQLLFKLYLFTDVAGY